MSSSRPAHDPSTRALRLARQYLRHGARSAAQLQAYLRRRGVPEPLREATVVACVRRRLVDDRAVAQLWAEHWAQQGYADAAIRHKLLAKGFHEHLADDTIAALRCDTDDEARARRALAGMLRRAGGRPSPSRLARALASRGFDSELIERVLRQLSAPSTISD